MPESVPLDALIQVGRLAVSFLTGALTLYGYLRATQTDLFRQLTIRRHRKSLRAAQEDGDREQAKAIEFQIQIEKLYLSDSSSQATAISYFVEMGDERAFEILAQRLGDKPPLTTEASPIMRWGIKKLALSMNSQRSPSLPDPSGTGTRKARTAKKRQDRLSADQV